jgi:hypothetical protein
MPWRRVHLLYMPRPSSCRQTFTASRLGIWLLALAMTFQSVSAAITGIAGAQHRHVACTADGGAPPWDVWSTLLRPWLGEGVMAIVAARQGLVHAASPRPTPTAFPVVWTGPLPDELVVSDAVVEAVVPTPATCHTHAHTHTHAGFERHVHAPHDPSAQAIGQADGGDDAGLLHADLPWGLEALPQDMGLAAPPTTRQGWVVCQQAQPRGWHPALLERPPRA